MNIINTILAGFIDKFKASNPTLAMFLMALLGTAIAFLSTDYATSVLGETVTQITFYITLVLGLLQGSRTSNFVEKK